MKQQPCTCDHKPEEHMWFVGCIVEPDGGWCQCVWGGLEGDPRTLWQRIWWPTRATLIAPLEDWWYDFAFKHGPPWLKKRMVRCYVSPPGISTAFCKKHKGHITRTHRTGNGNVKWRNGKIIRDRRHAIRS